MRDPSGMVLRGARLAVLAVAGLAVAFYMHLFFMITTCAVSDVADTKPAEASPQGWVCGDGTTWLTPMLFGFAAAALIGVVLTGLVWRRTDASRPRALALTLPFVMLAPAWVALSLPPDQCSTEAKRERPAYECETRTGV